MFEAKFKKILRGAGRTRFTVQLFDTTPVIEKVADPLTRETVERTRYDRKPIERVEFDIPRDLTDAEIVQMVDEKMGLTRNATLKTAQRMVTLSATR